VKGDFKSAVAFTEIGKKIAADGAAMVKKVGCVYRFDLTAADGAQGSWLVDLKNGSGAVRACANTDKADCMIAMKDADFLLLMAGKLNAQQAFMKGQLKIKGNMMLAQKLEVLTKPAAKL
jgi:putative sterol carrier protein